MNLLEFVKERDVVQLEIILGSRSLHVREANGRERIGTVEALAVYVGRRLPYAVATVRHFNGEMWEGGGVLEEGGEFFEAEKLNVIERPRLVR